MQLSEEQIEKGERRRRYLLSTILFFASLGLAVFIPNIGQVIDFSGGLASIYLFILPGKINYALHIEFITIDG